MLSKKKKGLHKNFSGDLKKKTSSQKFFKRSPQKNVFQKTFQALHKILTIQKIVLSSSRGQANFRGLEASRPRPRTSKSVLEDSTSAKDQGHRRKCSQKKKVFKKIFQAISKKVFKIFFQAKKVFKKLFFRRFPLEENKKRSSQIICEVSGAFQQNFNGSKNSAVLKPRTGQFSRTCGFEAKAKTKDFKICPRGQGRPRGLYPWALASEFFVFLTLASSLVSSTPTPTKKKLGYPYVNSKNKAKFTN